MDFFFLDHVKELYLADLLLAVELELLPPQSVTVADNVLTPGAPDYLAYMVHGRGKVSLFVSFFLFFFFFFFLSFSAP